MTDDAKEWVTVKIEEPVRDDAQDDPRTYTEIMRAGLESDRLGDALHSVAPDTDADAVEDVRDVRRRQYDVDLGDLREQLDRIESAAKEATNAAQSAEHAVENMGGR